MVDFTDTCEQISPMQVVNMLNTMFESFDKLITHHPKVYKVKYVCVYLHSMNVK